MDFKYLLLVFFLVIGKYKTLQEIHHIKTLDVGEELLLLQELNNNGAHYPSPSMFKQEEQSQYINQWNLTGMRRKYILGKTLKKLYPTFFSYYFKADEIMIRSSNIDRTIQSAFSELNGIFEDYLEKKKIDLDGKDIKLQPEMYKNFKGFKLSEEITFDTPLPEEFVVYPIHTGNEYIKDYLFKPDSSCTNKDYVNKSEGPFVKLVKNLEDTLFYKDTQKEIGSFFGIQDRIDILSKEKTSMVEVGGEISEYQLSSYLYSKDSKLDPTRSNSERDLQNKLQMLYFIHNIYTYKKQTNHEKISNSPILSYIGRNIYEKAKKLTNLKSVTDDNRFAYDTNYFVEWDPDHILNEKYIMLSTHKTNLEEFLLGLDQFDPYCLVNYVRDYEGIFNFSEVESCLGNAHQPVTSSVILIELVKKVDNNLVVRMNFDGIYQNICDVAEKANKNGKYDCELKSFFEHQGKVILKQEKFKELCYNKSPDTSNSAKNNETKAKQIIFFNLNFWIWALFLILASTIVVYMVKIDGKRKTLAGLQKKIKGKLGEKKDTNKEVESVSSIKFEGDMNIPSVYL